MRERKTALQSGGTLTPACSILKRPMVAMEINLVVWWTVFLLVNSLNCYLLPPGLELAQQIQFFSLGTLNTAILVSLLAVIDATVIRAWQGRRRWIIAVLASSLITYAIVDVMVFTKVGNHLLTLVRLAVENGWGQFWLLIHTTGIQWDAWMMDILPLVALVLGSFIIIQLSLCYTQRFAIRLKLAVLVMGLGVMCLLLYGFKVGTNTFLELHNTWAEYDRVHPIFLGGHIVPQGVAYHGVKLRSLSEKKPFKNHFDPEENTNRSPFHGAKAGPTTTTENPIIVSNAARPDIFIFVIDSLRGDVVNEETTPFLQRFQKDCIPVSDSIASANATALSWYSLFTGNHALRFGAAVNKRIPWKSRLLTTLCEWGYQIHVFAGCHLHYYGVDQILFGEKLELCSSLLDEREIGEIGPVDEDRIATEGMLKKIGEKQDGRLFVIFYDSTHHDYFWPQNTPPRFQPVARGWTFCDMRFSSPEIIGIKNRYLNAAYYVDGLFGQVINELKRTQRYENAVIFVTGDHGEEFYEHGRLVHGNEGCRVQTQVPWLWKLSADRPPPAGREPGTVIASHVDFLPSLLHFLGVPNWPVCDGESIWMKQGNYAVSTENNGRRDPFRFSIQNQRWKGWFEYRSRGLCLELENEFFLRKLTDIHDQEFQRLNTEAKERASDILETIRPQLFPNLAPHNQHTNTSALH